MLLHKTIQTSPAKLVKARPVPFMASHGPLGLPIRFAQGLYYRTPFGIRKLPTGLGSSLDRLREVHRMRQRARLLIVALLVVLALLVLALL